MLQNGRFLCHFSSENDQKSLFYHRGTEPTRSQNDPMLTKINGLEFGLPENQVIQAIL